MEKRYLIYKSWNGQFHVSIEYGEHRTGEGVKKDLAEVARYLIEPKYYHETLDNLKDLYPMENKE